MSKPIHYHEVLVSFHKGVKKTTISKITTWVIGADTTIGKINQNKEMIKQLEQRIYPKNYKGQRKLMVVKIFHSKFLGHSFFND